MAVNIDKERTKMLRAIRRKSAKRATPEETQAAARTVVNAIPPVAEVLAEAKRIRERLK